MVRYAQMCGCERMNGEPRKSILDFFFVCRSSRVFALLSVDAIGIMKRGAQLKSNESGTCNEWRTRWRLPSSVSESENQWPTALHSFLVIHFHSKYREKSIVCLNSWKKIISFSAALFWQHCSLSETCLTTSSDISEPK